MMMNFDAAGQGFWSALRPKVSVAVTVGQRAHFMYASCLRWNGRFQSFACQLMNDSDRALMHTRASQGATSIRLNAAEARLPASSACSILSELRHAIRASQDMKPSSRELRRAMFEATSSSESASMGAQLTRAAWKVPGHYAALRSVLTRLAVARPGWCPKHVLDVGSTSWGMGALASAATWRDRVLKTTVIDAEPTRLEVHRTWLGNDVLMRTYLEPEDMYDLVTAVHCRTEGSVAERSIEFFESLWHHCRGMLVIIEPGTEDGFAQMLAVRNHLLNLHGSAITVAAPCPHAGPCPLSAKSNATHPGDVPKDGFHHSFCHFAQRYERDRSLQKMNSIDHQKQRVMPSLRGQGMRRFSYVVLERIGDGAENDPAVETKRIQGRILREPLKRNGHVVLYLCQENGQVEQQAYTRRKHCDGTYRWARQASWGDEWPHPGVTAKPLDCDATPASA